MGTITTAMATSFKADLMSGYHCFNAIVGTTGTTTSASTAVTGVGTLTGVAVGEPVTGPSIAANTVVARITSTTAMTLSVAATGTNTAITFTGDSFFIALIKPSPASSFDATTTNYTALSTDEVANGAGYTTAGQLLVNVAPTTTGTTAFINFSPNPSWTSATFTTSGCMIYNNSQRSSVATKACSVHDFSGNQSVSGGTFTVVMPTAASSTAILRIS